MHALLTLLCSLVILLPGGGRTEHTPAHLAAPTFAAAQPLGIPSAFDFNLLDLNPEDFAIAEAEADTDEKSDDSQAQPCDTASSLIPPDLSPVAAGRSRELSRDVRLGLHPLRLSVRLRF